MTILGLFSITITLLALFGLHFFIPLGSIILLGAGMFKKFPSEFTSNERDISAAVIGGGIFALIMYVCSLYFWQTWYLNDKWIWGMNLLSTPDSIAGAIMRLAALVNLTIWNSYIYFKILGKRWPLQYLKEEEPS
jgi:hypothetical protein